MSQSPLRVTCSFAETIKQHAPFAIDKGGIVKQQERNCLHLSLKSAVKLIELDHDGAGGISVEFQSHYHDLVVFEERTQ